MRYSFVCSKKIGLMHVNILSFAPLSPSSPSLSLPPISLSSYPTPNFSLSFSYPPPPPSFRSNFSDFAMKYGKDERFKAMEKMRDREQLFSEYLSELKKASKMKDEQLRSAAKSKAEKVSEDIKH